MKHVRCKSCNKIIAILTPGSKVHKEGVYCAECYERLDKPTSGPVDCPEFFDALFRR